MMKRFVLILTILMLLLCACQQAPTGGMTDFSTIDLDGGAQDESIFSEHKLTMVNVWATYCSPCIREMPGLGELHKEYASEGFQIVGLLVDVADPESDTAESAHTIIANTGADYLHLLPAQSMAAFLAQVSAVPTTLFVDENGEQVGELYIGSREKEEWAAIIDELLEEVQ